MTDLPEDDFDLTAFPDVVNAVLDLMPTGRTWKAIFAGEPGLAVRVDAEDINYLAVLHAATGYTVMLLHRDTFRVSVPGGSARVMYDGEWQDVDLMPIPDVPDDLSGLDE